MKTSLFLAVLAKAFGLSHRAVGANPEDAIVSVDRSARFKAWLDGRG